MFTSILATWALAVSTVSADTYTQVTNFGTDPTGVGMYLYLPNKIAANPPLICTGTAQAYYQGTTYAQLAEQYGYIVIYPNAPTTGGYWDVATNATLTHNGGGDSLGIASMVRYAIAKYGVDSSRVFATGTSSGAMMTNVLAGAYPDIFAAGAAFSGVPYACFEGPTAWNLDCALGQVIKTPQQWAALVASGYPGYTGKRPRMQIWHGTIDVTLYYQNLVECDKQWPQVLGVSFSYNVSNTPLPNYTKMIYGTDGSQYTAYSAVGVGHTVPEQEQLVLDFFGISGTTAPTSSSVVVSPSSSTVAPPQTTLTTISKVSTTSAVSGTVPK
ncbi:hypothetical protein MMC25_007774 [Agyrium rufum]|nr:hypothetical protein [Agyrium rufum]